MSLIELRITCNIDSIVVSLNDLTLVLLKHNIKFESFECINSDIKKFHPFINQEQLNYGDIEGQNF